MSRFSTEFRANTRYADVIRKGQSVLEEMGLIFLDRDDSSLVFREKQRFDPFNPARIEIRIENAGTGTVVKAEGENLGEGPYQDTHVKRLIFELMDRLEEDLEDDSCGGDPSNHPDIARELDLLSELHSRGILTDAEFGRAKEKLLD